MERAGGSQVDRGKGQNGGETTNELNPLKGLTRLLTLVEIERKGGENL